MDMAQPARYKPRTMKLVDMSGMKFERLEVLKRVMPSNPPRWRCLCDCGCEIEVRGSHLRSGGTRSCGCLRSEKSRVRMQTHGRAGTREHRVWQSVRSRCENANIPSYSNYGGRGIKVCERWKSFTAFLEDMGPCPDDRSIDRIDNDGNYEPTNCRWATRGEQANNKRNTRWVIYQGRRQTISQWAGELGMSRATLANRIYRKGWSLERAMTQAARKSSVRP